LRAGSTVTANQIAGNSYIQVVTFGSHGVDAATLLSHSESDDPASPHFSDGTRRYAAQRWLRVPFHEQEIASDPDLQVTRLTMPAADGALTHASSHAAKNGHDGEDGR
jgi:acyl-homoserine-lactone acylase